MRYLVFFFLMNCAKAETISSPDKATVVEIVDGVKYRVFFHNKLLLDWSDLKQGQITKVKRSQVRSRVPWPLGERSFIQNNYNQLVLECTGFNMVFRVFNGSVAFRYELISDEPTEFRLTTPFVLYQYNHESVFTPTAIDTFTRTTDLPVTLVTKDHYLSIGEAYNIQYAKAELKKGASPNSLAITFTKDSIVQASQTPWRTISISTTAIGLHQFSSLPFQLSEPATTNNIPKPGKLIRAQLSTESGLQCIDFAAANNFQYIMYDAGWYGAEFRGASDPTQPIDAIDMQRVINYGKEKGIGVILYVNYVGLRAKLDTILPLYKKWGVSGLKFGFVDGVTQRGITWLAQAIRKVNDHGFILDIHDNYKPTGLSRTFPALLTQEGIRGDENSPDAWHNTVLPFTRFLAGAADFTFCFPNPANSFSKNIKVSKAQQLALTVVYFSPLQAIFWYGKPLDYTNTSDIEFFKYVPTVWDESHYLAGEIGKYISVTRRHGDTWFMGNVAGLEDWQQEIPCDFLTKGKVYTATIYEDDDQGGIRKLTRTLRHGDTLPVSIKAKGGQAIIIR